jgi:hypothetical protein
MSRGGIGSHHVKKIEDARACLNIVGLVQMGIVEFIVPVCVNAGKELKRERRDKRPNKSQPARAIQEKPSHIHNLGALRFWFAVRTRAD